MGNALLDFVMALVRDPEAAARFAGDPAAALADAHLPGVTIADVNNLIPVVTDSLAAATPGFGVAAGDQANVWTSGAAAAAFDAFDIHIPTPEPAQEPVIKQHTWDVPVDHPADEVRAEAAPIPVVEELPTGHPVEPVAAEWADDSAWQHPHVDPHTAHHPGDAAGFDLL